MGMAEFKQDLASAKKESEKEVNKAGVELKKSIQFKTI